MYEILIIIQRNRRIRTRNKTGSCGNAVTVNVIGDVIKKMI
jgi:hypothetical protein